MSRQRKQIESSSISPHNSNLNTPKKPSMRTRVNIQTEEV